MKLLFVIILNTLAVCACDGVAPKKAPIVTNDTVKAVAVDYNRHYNNALNQTARIIAGINVPTDTMFAPVRNSESWKSYAAESDTIWKRYDKSSDKLTSWVKSEVLPLTDTLQRVFYPFSGPDFLYGNLMFPNARTMYMLGLEEIGTIPDFSEISADQIDEYIAFCKRSISEVLQGSFYHTKNMKNYLHNDQIDGVTPVLMLFLAQRGKQISEVNFMTIDSAGVTHKVANDNKFKRLATRGVQIKYYNGTDDIEREIYFFTGNVADGGLGETPAYDKFYRSLRPQGAFVKSATYLMHKSYFSTIRNVLLDNCQVVVQDDSGIAYKFYDPKKWDIQLYGTYTSPIGLFSNLYEQDLYDAYRGGATVKPLNFRIGYSNPSNLRVAKRR